MINDARIPLNPAPYQQLVTNVDGKTEWVDRYGYEAEEREKVIGNNDELIFQNQSADLMLDLYMESFEEGKTYFVTWDGVKYECVAYIKSGVEVVLIGNSSIMGIGNDTGEPFLAFALAQGDESAAQFYVSEASGTHSVALSTFVGGTVPIPEKYIPTRLVNAALAQSDFEDFDEASAAFIKNKPIYLSEIEPVQSEISNVSLTTGSDWLSAGGTNVFKNGVFYRIKGTIVFQTDVGSYAAEIDSYAKSDGSSVSLGSIEVGMIVSSYSGTQKVTIDKIYSANHSFYDGNIGLRVSAEGSTSFKCESVTVNLQCYACKKLDEKLLPAGVPVVPVTADDNGKVLAVVDGAFKLVTLAELQS